MAPTLTLARVRRRTTATTDTKRGDSGWSADHDAYLAVEGAEPMPVPYYRSGGTFRPETLELGYGLDDGDSWTATNVRVSGSVLRANGTPGARSVSETFYGSELRPGGTSRKAVPEWVTEAVDTYRPTWRPAPPIEETP